MGYYGPEDLAPVFGNMFVQLRNEADRNGTFDVSYMAGHLGLEATDLEVAVGMGEQFIVEMPCSEVVGIGPLDEPGGVEPSAAKQKDHRVMSRLYRATAKHNPARPRWLLVTASLHYGHRRVRRWAGLKAA